MSSIASHLHGSGDIFTPEIDAIMEDAYQRACRSLIAPLSVRKALAEKVFQLTQSGERDPKTLCHDALAFLLVEGECQ